MGCNMDERIKEWMINLIKELLGSVKTLMLMVFDQSGNVFNASVCGDDCAKWILSIAKTKDLYIKFETYYGFWR